MAFFILKKDLSPEKERGNEKKALKEKRGSFSLGRQKSFSGQKDCVKGAKGGFHKKNPPEKSTGPLQKKKPSQGKGKDPR